MTARSSLTIDLTPVTWNRFFLVCQKRDDGIFALAPTFFFIVDFPILASNNGRFGAVMAAGVGDSLSKFATHCCRVCVDERGFDGTDSEKR
jgi:hypothetical protein